MGKGAASGRGPLADSRQPSEVSKSYRIYFLAKLGKINSMLKQRRACTGRKLRNGVPVRD